MLHLMRFILLLCALCLLACAEANPNGSDGLFDCGSCNQNYSQPQCMNCNKAA